MSKFSSDFTVIGAGPGGHSMAAELSLQGHKVRLYSYSGRNLDAIRKRGGIETEGVLGENLAKLKLVTTDVKEAIKGVKILLVCIAPTGHENVVNVLLPHLEKGQIVVFNTGYFSCIRFADQIESTGATLAESALLQYVALLEEPGRVVIYGIKGAHSIPFAAFHPSETDAVLGQLKETFPQFYAAKNVLQTSLENMSFILHPAMYVLNAGEIGGNQDLSRTYSQWTTKPVADVIDAFDRERIDLGKAVGVELIPTYEQFATWYKAKGKSTHEVLASSSPHSTASSNPFKLTVPRFRWYLQDDIKFGLVPLISISEGLNISMPCTKALVNLISIIDSRDYINEGFKPAVSTLKRMKIIEPTNKTK